MRFSLVIPTYQRRDTVVRNVAALKRQEQRGFEVIVAVDGSSDGTAAAVRGLQVPFPISVIEQSNQGAAVARNAGAAVARGELLLFLDDDMEADPAMLVEHDRSHREGAGMVLGHIPLHPDSPPTAIGGVTGRWAERRRNRLAASGSPVPVTDLLTGQMSISRAAFERLGGFDVSFTRGGLVPGADLDFGHRARKSGLAIVFNPAAISYQYYDVDATSYTVRSHDGARADLVLSAKYPELAEELKRRRQFRSRGTKIVFGTLAIAPSALSWPLRRLAIRSFNRARPDSWSHRLFFDVQTMERVRGARSARRALRTGHAVVLAYHAISDLRGDRVLGEYGVPPAKFAAQLDMLAKRGWRFVDLDAVLRALDGEDSLPDRAILLTFDDGYTDLLTAACPILTERGVPAVAFAVTDRIGGTNDWSRRAGASILSLLDEDGLRAVAAQGVVIGSHGATHRPLVTVDPLELDAELRGSAERLCSLGLPRPAAFSYPHGEWNPEIAAAVHDAGYQGGFTVTPGVLQRGENRYALPRIEVPASDTPLTLRIRLATAAWPAPWRRRALQLMRART